MPTLIDSHCHLDLAAFDDDRTQVLADAQLAGISDIVIPAVMADGWEQLHDLCSTNDSLHPAYGLHPMFMRHHAPDALAALRNFLQGHRAVAIGECGLDFHAGRDDAHAQRKLLCGQLELSLELDLPVILHARRALQDVTQLIKETGHLKGVVHSFSGSQQQADQLFELGLHIGIGGVVTYPRARRLRQIVAAMPLHRLLLETDSPDQPLCGYQGERNTPARLPEILAAVAELRKQDLKVVAEATSSNARRLFHLT